MKLRSNEPASGASPPKAAEEPASSAGSSSVATLLVMKSKDEDDGEVVDSVAGTSVRELLMKSNEEPDTAD
jgi:hypothetical protein